MNLWNKLKVFLSRQSSKSRNHYKTWESEGVFFPPRVGLQILPCPQPLPYKIPLHTIDGCLQHAKQSGSDPLGKWIMTGRFHGV